MFFNVSLYLFDVDEVHTMTCGVLGITFNFNRLYNINTKYDIKINRLTL